MAMNQGLKFLILFFYSLASVSCSSPQGQKTPPQSSASLSVCEHKLKSAFQVGSNPDLVGHVKQVSGKVVSYAWTGANYTAEFLWDVTSGILVLAALCGPVLAAQAASSGYAHSQPLQCLPGRVDVLVSPRLGEKAYRDSAPLRCPDLSDFSSQLKEVLACIPEELNSEERQRIRLSLRNLMNSGEMFSCLDEDVKSKIENMFL